MFVHVANPYGRVYSALREGCSVARSPPAPPWFLRYLGLVRARRGAILISAGGAARHGAALAESLRTARIDSVVCIFGGECSLEEIDKHAGMLKTQSVDCVLAVGGGKCVDAGKAVAFRLDTPVVIAPTLASNDAPCSALSVLYTPAGASSGVEFYPCSPALMLRAGLLGAHELGVAVSAQAGDASYRRLHPD